MSSRAENKNILKDGLPDRTKPLADYSRGWKVELKGGTTYYLTTGELEFYLAQKENGATSVMFPDFGLETGYKSWAPNRELKRYLATENTFYKQDAKYPELTLEEKKENLKAWQELKKKIGKIGGPSD